ncbi:MAG: bifunctional UDP-sugar hydrolase/5'-nucleotidase [Candidatus Methylomirabilales bacterium]
MKVTRRALLALLASLVLLLGLAPSLPAAAPAERTARFTLLQVNDLYDLTPNERGKKGGLARVATIRERVAAESPYTILVLAGDFLSPSTVSSLFQGEQMVAGLNAAGLELATFGNHEFDFGEFVTRERMRESWFTWVSSNVLDPKTGLPFGEAAAFVLRDVGGVKVAFLGLTTPETKVLSKGGRGLTFLPPIQAAKAVIPRARRAGADVIVALTHQAMDDDKALAAAVPDIHVILGGHEHVPLDARVGKTLILKTGSEAMNVGRVDVRVAVGKTRTVEATWSLIPVTDRVPDKPEVAALVKRYQQAMAAELEQKVGETSVALDTRNALVRTQEAPVGNFVADLIRDSVQADVALVNGGGLRGDSVTPAGPLRRGDVLRILPFANKIVKLEVTGETLRAALENGLSQVEKTAGRFPQVSGMRVVFDPSRPPGSRLVSVQAKGRPLDAQARYTLATFEFLQGGGDGYEMLKQAKVLVPPQNGPMDSDLVLERLALGPLAPVVDGRIQEAPR